MVNKIGLEVHDHLSPYMFGWVNKDEKTNIKIVVSAYVIHEVDLYVVHLDVCSVVFGTPISIRGMKYSCGEKTNIV
jgi:hypothetical protein